MSKAFFVQLLFIFMFFWGYVLRVVILLGIPYRQL